MLRDGSGMYIDRILYGRKLLPLARFLYGSEMEVSPLQPEMHGR